MFDLTKEIKSQSPMGQETREVILQTSSKLKGSDRRNFMAQIVKLMGKGGQRRAQREFGWDRNTIRKAMRELETGIICIDGFSARGRRPVEADKLPYLLEDIKDIVDPLCQTDPTFQTTELYSPLTAKEVRRRLIEIKGYSKSKIPSRQTINTKMNQLGYKLKKVSKCKPKKNPRD